MTDRLETVRAALADFVPGVYSTPAGSVDLRAVEVVDGAVEVTIAGAPDPHYRICNPPTAPDPLSAIAHAVALHGGALR